MVDEYLQQQQDAGKNPFIILHRPQGSVEINGERMTAKQALNRFPLPSAYLQQKKILKDKSFQSKFLRDYRGGKIPEHILYEDPPQFNFLDSNLRSAKVRYRLHDQRIKYRNLESLFEFIKQQALNLIIANPNTKVGLSVSPWMIKRSGKDFIKSLKGLHSGARFENFQGTNPEALSNAMCEVIREQLHRMGDMEGSGWVVESINHVIFSFHKIPAIVGSSYQPLPMKLEMRRQNGMDNINNSEDDDQHCAMWAATRAMFPPKEKPTQRDNVVTKKLREQSQKLKWDDMSFPTSLFEWDVFENMNKVSVMILGWDDDNVHVIYLRHPNTRHEKNIQLFYYNEHYSTVQSMSTLMSNTMSEHTYYFCPYCTYNHRRVSAVENHKKFCRSEKVTIEKMPSEKELYVTFKNWNEIVFKSFVIWADFECRLEKINIKKSDKTTQTHIHRASGYCLRLVSRVDPSESRTISYTAKTSDENIAEHFIKTVNNLVLELGKKYSEERPLLITEEEQTSYDNATTC